jgi:hypothetical protein
VRRSLNFLFWSITMIKGLMITPPVLGRISIGKVVEKGGKRLPEKDDQFTITNQVQNKDGWIPHPLDDALRKNGDFTRMQFITLLAVPSGQLFLVPQVLGLRVPAFFLQLVEASLGLYLLGFKRRDLLCLVYLVVDATFFIGNALFLQSGNAVITGFNFINELAERAVVLVPRDLPSFLHKGMTGYQLFAGRLLGLECVFQHAFPVLELPVALRNGFAGMS